MSTGGKVALGCGIAIGVFLLVCVVSILLGSSWLKRQWPGLVADMGQSEREARAFGPTHLQGDCITEALRRIDPCSPMDVRCALRASSFMDLCLRAAQPVADLCTGVPAPRDDLMVVARWRTDQCTRLGRSGDGRCANLMSGLQGYCANPRPLPDRLLFGDGGPGTIPPR